jgi:hypothetical protein
MKAFSWIGFLLALIIILYTPHPALGGLVPQSSQINAYAYAELGGNLDFPVISNSDTHSVSQGSAINPLSTGATAYINYLDDYATSSVQIGSTWNSSASGSVVYTGMLKLYNGEYSAGENPNGAVRFYPGSFWSYTFLPDLDGTFSIAWGGSKVTTNLKSSGDPVVSDRIQLQYRLNGGGTHWDQNASVTNIPVTSGNPFTIDIGWITNGISLAGVGAQQIDLYNTADWTFTPTSAPVPVPPSVWLLGSGLIGLVGLRRRFLGSNRIK